MTAVVSPIPFGVCGVTPLVSRARAWHSHISMPVIFSMLFLWYLLGNATS